MKIQFVSQPDAAGKIRAHVALDDESVLVLKYDAKEFSAEKTLEDAAMVVIQRSKLEPEPEPIDEVQQAIDSVGVDAILERIGVEVVKAKYELLDRAEVEAQVAQAVETAVEAKPVAEEPVEVRVK